MSSPKPTFIYVYPERFRAIRRTLKAMLVAAGLLGFMWLAFPEKSLARPLGVHPITAPTALVKARAACPVDATRTCYLTALRKAYAGLEWAQAERTHRWAPTVEHAIQLACASQPTLDCSWFRRMIGCESGRDPFSSNRHSTAKGLAQFLDGTWSGNLYGRFNVFDPVANALGAAWLAVRNGHAPWYASKGCWG